MDVSCNTVSALDQMINSGELSYLGDENAKKRILIVGNSITRHGPRESIGWSGDWGMAASAPEKDFVHRLYEKLKAVGQDVFIRVRQCAYWEMSFLTEENILSRYDAERAWNADIVVFRLGENVPKDNKIYFKEAMKKFVEHICPTGKIVYTTCFWKNEIVDKATMEIAKERGEVCVDGYFSANEENMALGQFEHGGVAKHPSDKGMEVIAETFFQLLKE